MKTLILAEARDGELSLASRRLLGAAQGLGPSLTLLLWAPIAQQAALADQAATLGVTQLLWLPEALADFDVMTLAESLLPHLAAPCRLLTDHLPEPVALLGLLAARTGWPLLTDVIAMEVEAGPLRLRQGMCDDGAQLDYAPPEGGLLLSLRSCVFPSAMPQPVSQPQAEELSFVSSRHGWQSLAVTATRSAGPSLDEAPLVVGGGRPLGKQLMPLLGPLAASLGGVVGASRGAVDAGHAPAHCQIGLTGAHIAPAIYLAVGVSGAPQHLAGVGPCPCIIAINKDANAPILARAHYWWQGDMLTLLPALQAALAAEIPA